MNEFCKEISVSDALIETLVNQERYAALPSPSLVALVELGTLRKLQPEEVIVREGEPSPSVFVVVRGRLKMTRSLSNGRNALLALFSTGDPIGLSVLGGRPSDATVSALESSVCLEIPCQDLLRAMSADSQLLADLLGVFTEQVAECRNCLIEGSFLRVEPRLALLFLRLADSAGQERGDTVWIPVPLSRLELADMAGTTIETCIRVMSRWKKSGLVETRKAGFLLMDRQGLAEIVGCLPASCDGLPHSRTEAIG